VVGSLIGVLRNVVVEVCGAKVLIVVDVVVAASVGEEDIPAAGASV
jgi:hypothetical protein